jgi:hypothetical protein
METENGHKNEKSDLNSYSPDKMQIDGGIRSAVKLTNKASIDTLITERYIYK